MWESQQNLTKRESPFFLLFHFFFPSKAKEEEDGDRSQEDMAQKNQALTACVWAGAHAV